VTAWDDDVERSVPQRFELQVLYGGTRLAVAGPRASLTYGELDGVANRLAHTLQAVATTLPVALLLDHDGPLAAAMLGVLKSGRICLPLAVSHPEARQARILEDSGAEVLVADREHLAEARRLAGSGGRVIAIEEIGPECTDPDARTVIPPDGLALLLYTSGSTGRPHGVLHTHRNVLSNVRRLTRGLDLGPEDRIAVLASPSTMQGMTMTFSALVNGCTLCLYDVAGAGITGLADWLRREQITVLDLAASVFRHFARTLAGPPDLPHLRMIRLASEPVRPMDVQRFRELFPPHCILLNTLSSTETGNMTQFRIHPDCPLTGDSVPVGYAADGVEVLVVDEERREIAAGTVGEIAVRSRYLSPGYWRDPEQTRAVFAEAPESGLRTYFTRDLGRMRPDGCLEHLGRKDDLVKIRGFRVHPEEIRRLLAAHPSAIEAAVEARQGASGETQLIAFVVPDRARPPTPRELRRYLGERLPWCMVPASVVLLDELPRLAGGKVDRHALRALAPQRTPATEPEPGSPIHELLAGIFGELLGLDAVRLHESFFELGGDSLLVVQLLCYLEEVLAVEIPLQVAFEESTIAELAAAIQRIRSAGGGTPVPRIEPVPRDRPAPLSFSQERIWRYCQTPAQSAAYTVAHALVLRGRLDVEALRRSLSEVVRRHEGLRTRFSAVHGQPVQMVDPPQPVPLREMDLSTVRLAEEAFQQLWAEEAEHPVDLGRGPMLRATLVRMAAREHRLLLTYHHIASDAWSQGVLLRDLGACYEAFGRGELPRLPELAVQYADFAVWQRQLLRPDGGPYRAQLGYWRQQLAGSPVAIECPCGNSRVPAVPNCRDSQIRFRISREVSQRLRTLGRREGATLFMTRLAAFAALLGRATGKDDFVLATYATNRSRPELQRVVGFFTNLLMLRLDLTGDPTFTELLARVRATTVDAAGHGDLPFEVLCEELCREGCAPPDVKVIFQSRRRETSFRFGDVEVRVLERTSPGMPWRLQVTVDETEDQTAGWAHLDTNLYDPAGVSRLIAGYESLLAAVAKRPDLRVADLPIPSSDE
jgi:amino acid adenylation domain-containing protein